MSTVLTSDATEIWQAGVQAVDSSTLVRQCVLRSGDQLSICGEEFALSQVGRIVVLGGGKAGAGMAAGVEAALGPELVAQKVTGWLNVPADCLRPLQRIVLHAARPAGVNEPRPAGVAGAEQILMLAAELRPDDLCLVLLSGGGSALLPAPRDITLDDKLAVTRLLSQRGADIRELNTVRQCLSRFKGGGLLRAAANGKVRTLIISDVIGDPIDIIASGPTSPLPLRPQQAREILQRYARDETEIPAAVWSALALRVAEPQHLPRAAKRVHNHIIGNNRTALEASAVEARQRGYEVQFSALAPAGLASDAGTQLADEALQIQQSLARTTRRVCLLSGGEPVVALARTERPRKGGRNQELVLAAWLRLQSTGCRGISLLSGGTDGEDGPTDAAGAWIDAEVAQRINLLQLDAAAELAINNSYPFFERAGGLLKTGPTHTNVMDVRVALIEA